MYVVRSSAPISVGGSAQTQHVLKRLAVPDKTQLQEVRKEVENMASTTNMYTAVDAWGLYGETFRRSAFRAMPTLSTSSKPAPLNSQAKAAMRSLSSWNMSLVRLSAQKRPRCFWTIS